MKLEDVNEQKDIFNDSSGGGVAGKWVDESGGVTLNLKSNGTGTLEAYIPMFKSTTVNNIRYEKDGDNLKIFFEDDAEFTVAPITDGKLMYMNLVFTKQ